MTERHLVLEVPLTGVQLIEASAGTGKTFTLALLAARLVIERGLRVEQALVVTFTRAATQELRERLRATLRLARRLADDDAVLRTASIDGQLLWTMIRTRLASGEEDAAGLQRRLRRAELDIDLAPVFTIDGFCLRVLADDALVAGQALTPPTLLGSERDLMDEVALEAWRWASATPAQGEALTALWPTPTALARQLPALVRDEPLLPPPPPATKTPDATDELTGAESAVRNAARAGRDTARAAFDAAIAGKVLNGKRYTSNTIAKAWRDFDRWLDAPAPASVKLPDLYRLGTQEMQAAVNSGKVAQLPVAPLFDAIQAWLDALPAFRRQQAQVQLQLVHALRAYARDRLAHWKQTRQVQTFGDLIAQLRAALDGAQGEALAAALRARYPAALVDEFQDTDPQQWALFERLYVRQPELGLFLVGDPKQAIYGFRGGDVHTYLRARQVAGRPYALTHNFRSRPRVLQAIAMVFGADDDAFAEPGIVFTPVTAGGQVTDGDFQLAGGDAPGLTVHVLTGEDEQPLGADAARELAARACTRRIRDLLDAGRRGEAIVTVKQQGERRSRGVEPGDIAILVARHQDATLMQQALAEAGIASTAAGKRSLFETDEADELLRLLDAVAAPGDDRRLRSALATVLIGEDARALATLAGDEDRHRAWLDALQAWRERWDRHGPLAMIADRVAAAGPRLLTLADGERRLGNYLQLAEALQEASAAALGPAGLSHWLARRIAEADDRDEAQQLRLESDAGRVQILTLHKSKGLEFPLVFLPFLASPPADGSRVRPALRRYHDGHARVTRIEIADAGDTAESADAAQREQQQRQAEQLRLLYVGLTRAQHALWLAWGAGKQAPKTALAWLLHRANGQVPARLDASAVADALAALAARAPTAIEIAHDDPHAPIPRLPPLPRAAPPPLRPITRELSRDWWVYSFSQLSREDGSTDERGAEDEPRPALPPADPRFAGARFGNALHSALEHVVAARWRDDPAELPDGEQTALAAALRGEGYGEHELTEGIALLARLVRATLTTPLPEGTRLCDLPPSARRAEMEFHFAFRATRVDALIALLHAHGYLAGRQGFGARQRLEGLMTGKIDLVYEAAGRVYLLDYKSNQLPDYAPTALAAAMHESEYDLQYLLYTLALHRWLRFRRGAAYDYDRDFGGVRYLFCRGLDAQRDDGTGIYAAKPARALIEALDALLAPPAEVAA